VNFNYPGLDDFLLAALHEDIGFGDVTTNSCIPRESVSNGVFMAKEPGVICGLEVVERIFGLLDTTVMVTARIHDGCVVKAGDVVAEISGPSRSILTGERTALNLLQHMSGIATRTAEAVHAVSGTKAKIVDTRKTTPCMRAFDKYAVRCGGGTNHRFNLSDGVLIKDNHIMAAGGIANAIALARGNSPQLLKIEVEAETLPQVKEAIEAGADVIMLDNMTADMMADAVKMINGRALTEASGNMGERDLEAVARTGVDFISIGALTHSVKSLDISLKLSY
jgi:nicotinate-nucleotide pyrophosphorylase (carboxylating)